MTALLPLPIDSFLPEIVEALKEGVNLVLVAEPGAGKTTRIPPAIAVSGVLSVENPVVVMLQPRRVAARAAAERIGEERGWRVGEEVGYQVRFERRIGAKTVVRVVTEAILSRQLLSDPELPGVGCVILDEFHERSVHSDLALALLKEVQGSLRPDLKIVVMSATLDAEPVAEFLGGARVLKVPGRVFPVEVEYRVPRSGGRVEELAAEGVRSVIGEEGHILCFLPGAQEIMRAGRLLAGMDTESVVLPLHGSLPFEEQRRAIAPSARRKIILATNIAETSLTIDGVRVVIDSGLAREISYDPRRGLEKLSLTRISKASATQRAGRAGRTGPGRCLRLWTAREQVELSELDVPELRRIDLASTLLTLLTWGVRDVRAFGWFEAPADENMAASLRLLRMLGAVEGRGDRELSVTGLGSRMAGLPLHPRFARLMVDAVDEGRAEEGAEIAAMLSERDFRLRERGVRHSERGPREIADSDLTPRMELLAYTEKRGFHASLEEEGIDVVAARQVVRTKAELLGRARDVKRDISRRNLERDLVLGAYPDRVCVRRPGDLSGMSGLMVGGVGVVLAPESAVRNAPLFLALDAREDDRAQAKQASVELAHAVTEEDLRRAFPEAFSRVAMCVYDAAKDKVVGRVQTRYYDLVLSETDDARVEDEAAAEALARTLLPELSERIGRDEEGANLLARIRLAAKHVKPPAGQAWPSESWEEYFEELKGAMMGARRLADFKAGAFLRSLLVWPMERLLEEQVPEKWEVPTGNRIRIDYTGVTAEPRLAVRLQEMFGATVTPSICGGRVPIVLELLSPGYKPVQVTRDLVSFWANTYLQVKKDLKVRYPKHSWPEDPLTAVPVAKGRARK